MRALLWIIPAAILLLYLLTGVVQVRPGERAVVRRFGRVLEEKPEPGLWVGLPWGMDRVDLVAVDKVRQVSVGYSEDEAGLPSGQFLTGDHNLVNVRVLLYYKVGADDAAAYVAEGGPRVEAILERLLETAAGEWVAGRAVDDVLLVGKTQMRGELIERLRQRVGPYRLGVDLVDVRVEQIAPPDEVRDAFDSVSRAQTQMATAKYRAEQEAATRQRLARATRYGIDQSAQSYAHGAKLLARKDAGRFRERLKQYEAAKKRPDYLRQVWQEERGRVLQKLKEGGQIDLLDHRLGENGLELFTAPGKR
jgi:modulator of FtsH protease HflK